MNLIDLAAIIPYYIDMGVKLYLPDGPCPDSRMGFLIRSVYFASKTVYFTQEPYTITQGRILDYLGTGCFQ